MAKKTNTGVGKQWLYDLMEKPVGRLYLLCGEETFRRDAAVGILKKRLIDPSLETFNLRSLEGRGLTAETLTEALDRPPMMAERTLILVRDFDVYKSKWLEPIIKDIPAYACLVFIYDTLECKPDARTKLHAAIKAAGELAEFTPAPPDELAAWIRSRCKGLGVRIGADEIRLLVTRCGGLMQGLAGEIDKLCLYVGKGAVTARDIEDATCAVPEAQVFRLCDALSARDGRLALHLLNDLETAREEAIPVLALIGRQMRNLYTARLVLDANGSVSEIEQLCKLRFSFQTDSLVRAARRLALPGLRAALRLCAEADLALKSSRAEDFDILRDLVLSLYRALGEETAA
ncbi:MAG: DNA polymerase III subunit delta [Clostridiaceae bacterium]|nr:DNA polymerase III subunit delta [Clostridiaceae bacterium]